MEPVHLHLLINHVPILATIFSVLIMLWGLIKSEKSFVNLAMVGFIIAGIFSIVAFLTGDASEDTVELLAGVSESFIHEHEEAAEIANIIAVALAIISIIGFVIKKYKPAFFKTAKIVVVVTGFISAGMFSYTAYLGGQIRHIEIQPSETEEVEFLDSCSDGEEETLGDEFAE